MTHASWGDLKEKGFKRSIRISIVCDSSTNPFLYRSENGFSVKSQKPLAKKGGVPVTGMGAGGGLEEEELNSTGAAPPVGPTSTL